MRALFSFFFFPMNNGLLTKLPHKKKHPKKTKKKKKKKKCPSSSPLRLRPPTACTSATSRGRPPSRSYKRCSRTRRASRSQPCVSSSSSFVVVVAPRFVFCIPGGSFKARAEKSDDDGDQNRESADSFDDGIRASNRRRRKHARRRVAGPPSLSLSLDGRRRKRRRRKRTARLESTRRLLYRKETQRDRRGARAFAFVVVVESPKKEKA